MPILSSLSTLPGLDLAVGNNLDMQSGPQTIINMPDPVNPGDAVSLAYMQSFIQGLSALQIDLLDPGDSSIVVAPQMLYIPTSSSTVTFTLPALMPKGSMFQITSSGLIGTPANSWILTQSGSEQQIIMGVGRSTPGLAGSIAATQNTDTVTIVCVVANTTFLVSSSFGNITVT